MANPWIIALSIALVVLGVVLIVVFVLWINESRKEAAATRALQEAEQRPCPIAPIARQPARGMVGTSADLLANARALRQRAQTSATQSPSGVTLTFQ